MRPKQWEILKKSILSLVLGLRSIVDVFSAQGFSTLRHTQAGRCVNLHAPSRDTSDDGGEE